MYPKEKSLSFSPFFGNLFQNPHFAPEVLGSVEQFRVLAFRGNVLEGEGYRFLNRTYDGDG